jgi:hypothetical protein
MGLIVMDSDLTALLFFGGDECERQPDERIMLEQAHRVMKRHRHYHNARFPGDLT